jgi:hypothetical protein
MIRVRAALMAGAAATCGCTLIDQTTFAPEPDPKPAPVAAVAPAAPPPVPAPDARVPLLTIRYDVPAPDYGTVLPIAVRTAKQRRPGVAFDVVSVIASAADAPQGEADAAEVSRAIAKLGIPAERIHLGVRVDPSATLRSVLVYPT